MTAVPYHAPWTSDVRCETRRVRGLETVLRTSGQPGPEAVVFVHGFFGSGADFEQMLRDVGGFSYAVALDMPNHGRSVRTTGLPRTVQGYADHLAAVLAELRIERVHLVLHDFGGPWGLTWAVDHLEAVASISLFNIGIMPGYRWHRFARAWRVPLLGELLMFCMRRWIFRAMLRREYPRPLPSAFLDRMYDDIDSQVKRAGLELYRATESWAALSEELGARLGPHRFPALVVWGEADRNLPVHYAFRQADYFTVEEVHVLPGCGHWPFVDEPAYCSALLQGFLRPRMNGACDDTRPERRSG